MTIIDLIEKLKKEALKQMDAGEEPNGAYGVLEEYCKEMLALNPDRDYKKINDYFNKIHGFIWGLRAAYYITSKECDQLAEDLLKISRSFHSVND